MREKDKNFKLGKEAISREKDKFIPQIIAI